MFDNLERSLTVAGTIDEALAERRQGAAILAGGTWLMRDMRKGLNLPQALVSLHAVPGFTSIDVEANQITIGAAVTHEALGRALSSVTGLEAVAAAATGAANPAIRRAATIGGNLCSSDFAAADLAPAFLAVDALVELQTDGAQVRIPVASFLANRRQLLGDSIITKIILPRDNLASAHARLPLRRAGDYPVAIVSVALSAQRRIRIGVGSVEDVARRWTRLEEAFAGETDGKPANADMAEFLATQCDDFKGRDGIEADGWYRQQVLPTLIRRSMEVLLQKDAAR
ncbi:molybdopterin dehydrogenase [Agrobacterium larrymoorei]|uniref:FAD binding domain-containing protein n=1 Tax=Agrobacterium larrymoorei TaxID=160699 RepID=UPI0015719233|nr:FAD binding domain-containing protein [Agrobacterium larrymoorei]NTJ43854.1 molybdopterin dehydrogenase [Agrobacterium larrymoorei]